MHGLIRVIAVIKEIGIIWLVYFLCLDRFDTFYRWLWWQ